MREPHEKLVAGVVERQTVAGMLEFLMKKDYKPFFEAHYWGTGMPAD